MFAKLGFDAYVLMLAHEWLYLSKIVFLHGSKTEWQCNMSLTEYGKPESDGVWSIK